MVAGLDSFTGYRSMWRLGLGMALVLVLVGLSTVPSMASPAAKHKIGGTVVIDNVQGSLWTCGFNPYGSSTSLVGAGIIYEPLWYVNADNGHGTPWLAKKVAWSNGNKKLTFTIRKGVKWTDGKKMTARDVVFTFKLLKKFPGVDVNAIWTVLSKVSSHGNKVVLTFKRPAVPFFYYIGDQTFILPRHLWHGVKNPVTYADKNPVGTGPFKLSSCSPQNITYTRNPHYWQKGKPYVSTVQYPAYISNDRGNLDLQDGTANWGAQYIPNIKAYYIQGKSTRHYWFPPQGYDIFLYPNLKKWPTKIPAVRKAISIGLNRSRVSKLGVYGYLPPAPQSGVIVPNWKSWYDKKLAAKYNYSYRPKRAMKMLKKAGFKRGSDGIFRKHGKKLSLKVINVGGYTDWVAEVSVIAKNLRKIGIDLTPVNLSGDTHGVREQLGQFQLAYDSPLGGPAPYYQFRQLLDSANSAPLGKLASSNYERFHSRSADKLFNRYAATNNSKAQHRIINKIQAIMLKQVPVIPVLEGVNWYEYDTSQLTGWVTRKHPYAAPAAYNYPDDAVVLLHLRPK